MIAIKMLALWADVLEKATHTWVCRHCGAKTTVLSEMCSACRVEDCEQGS